MLNPINPTKKPGLNFLERIAFCLFRGDPTLERFRTAKLRNLGLLLYRFKITPNRASALGLLCAISAALFLSHPIIAGLFIVCSLIWDGLDGVIARVNRCQSRFGSCVDVFCDTMGNIAILISFSLHGYLEFWLFIISVLIVLSYTFLCSLKSNARTGVFISVGSRISLSMGGVMILSLAALDQELYREVFGAEFYIIYYQYFMSGIVILLSMAFLLDLRHISICFRELIRSLKRGN
jgi:phosphatidylglycerophosphate synthase